MSLTPEILLHGYSIGIFPMAEAREADDVFWVDPRRRGVIPLDSFHISRSLARELRSDRLAVSIDRDFAGVVDGCADRAETWINGEIRDLYQILHTRGHAHSLEVWDGDDLAGGVYGVVLGAAFFGESMFSRRRNASKVALAHLVDRLRRSGFTLFDTQFLTAHLKSLGAVEITRAEYQRRLAAALSRNASFSAPPISPGHEVVQRNTQTS